MPLTEAERQDELLPAHKRRLGRIGSLHEFQQRALSYDEQDGNPFTNDDTYVQIASSPKISDVDSDFLEAFRRHAISIRSRSTGSIFGDIRNKVKNRRNYYHRQLKALSFLILLGVIGGPLGYGMRRLGELIRALRTDLIGYTSSVPIAALIWTAHTVIFSQLGLLITRLSPVAAGSGVSQMKSILTGIDPQMYLPGYFGLPTLLAKIGGLVCAVGSGLIVGTEGAYVHIMSNIAHHLLQSPAYANFADRLNARLQLLAAACAVGVSSTFYSPIGGVLFSMEVTSTYYLMSNYMKAFISSISGALMVKVTLDLADSTSKQRNGSILATSFPTNPYELWEFPLYIVLGALIGLMSTAMVWLLRIISERRFAFKLSQKTWKQIVVVWIDPLVVAVLTATLTYFPGVFTRETSLNDLSILFTETDLPSSWQVISRFYALIVLCGVYILLIPFCITLRIPTGVWLPTFIAGAAFGRFFGESLHALLPSIIRGTYALAGAAAFAGAATRTVSAAVITLEITGTMELMIPIFLATLASIGVSNLFNEKSVYDTLLVVSGLPYLPLLDFDTTLSAGDIVETHLVYVTKRTTIAKLLLAIQRLPDQDIPVVQNDATMILLGVVSSSHIKAFIRRYYELHNVDGVEIDLGEPVKSNPSGFSWGTLIDNFSGAQYCGLNGKASVNQTYNQLSITIPNQYGDIGEGGAMLPFLMDDDKMLRLMSEGWSDRKQELLSRTIKITEEKICIIRPMAMTISSATPLDDLHMIFTMLRCDHCFVCDQGAFTGVVTTNGLLKAGKCCAAA